MRLVYSAGAELAGDGRGFISYHTLREAHARGVLARVHVSSHRPTELDPVVKDFLPGPLAWCEDRAAKGLFRLGLFKPAHLAHAWLFDRVVSRRLGGDGGTVLHVWQGYGLRSLRAARGCGMTTVLECCNAHIDNVQDVLSRERARMGFGPSEIEAWVRRLRAEYEAADFLCCPSGYVARSFLERGVPLERLIIVPYGVDSGRYRPGERRDGTFRVVFVGDDMLRKGAHVLLEAWRRLALPDAELVLCGSVYPQVRPLLRRLASPGVTFTGNVRDVVSRYQDADVLALPTFEDGFGLAILEAMACGLPVVTTPASAGPDLVEEGKNGYVVPAGDAEALAERLRHLHRARGEAARMGTRARATALTYTWERRGQGLLEALRARGVG